LRRADPSSTIIVQTSDSDGSMVGGLGMIVWSVKPPPKVLQTVLGAVAIVVIVLLGLAYGNPSGQCTPACGRATPAPSQSPSPHPTNAPRTPPTPKR